MLSSKSFRPAFVPAGRLPHYGDDIYAHASRFDRGPSNVMDRLT
jgi:hypothetical protein